MRAVELARRAGRRSRSPRPGRARRRCGGSPASTPRSASSSAVARLPQKSAMTSGVPPSPRAETSTRAPASSSISRHHREVAVGGLVQRGPAVGVGVGDVRAVVEQQPDEPFVARRARHPQQVVAVGPARGGELREARRAARRARRGRAPRRRDTPARTARPMSRRPVTWRCSAAQSAHPCSRATTDRAPSWVSGTSPEQRHRARRPVHGGSEQALGATLVVLDILVVGVPDPWDACSCSRLAATGSDGHKRLPPFRITTGDMLRR